MTSVDISSSILLHDYDGLDAVLCTGCAKDQHHPSHCFLLYRLRLLYVDGDLLVFG